MWSWRKSLLQGRRWVNIKLRKKKFALWKICRPKEESNLLNIQHLVEDEINNWNVSSTFGFFVVFADELTFVQFSISRCKESWRLQCQKSPWTACNPLSNIFSIMSNFSVMSNLEDKSSKNSAVYGKYEFAKILYALWVSPEFYSFLSSPKPS